MEENFKKIIYYSLFFLFILALALFFFFFQKEKIKFFFKKEAPQTLFPPLKIDFSILDSQKLRELEPLPQIPPLEEEIGKENPFSL